MKVGFIGAGKAGCSLGKYFSLKAKQAELEVTGYYSSIEEEARWAAEFTASSFFSTIEAVIAASDTIVISTPDGAIKTVWELLKNEKIKDKIICHLSGSLSSDVFSEVERYEVYPISIHPMFAFSNKESVYEQLQQVSFTLEGNEQAVLAWKTIFSACGNDAMVISKEIKTKYHAAASFLSNQVIAVLETGYELLCDCGFSEQEARKFSSVLVRNNVEQVILDGGVQSLTGPLERGDCQTVQKHLAVLEENQKELYKSCGRKLLYLAKQKNPKRDYSELENILDEK